MQRGIVPPAELGSAGPIESIAGQIDSSSRLQKLTAALLAVWTTAVMTAGVQEVQRAEALALDVAACADTDIACQLGISGLDVPAQMRRGPIDAPIPMPAPETAAPLPETIPPSTVMTEEVPVTTLPEVPVIAAEAAPGSLEYYIARVPRLENLAQQGIISPGDAAIQRQHIEWLRQNTVVNAEDYQAWQLDNETYSQSFREHPHFGRPIEPWRIVVHWAGRDYPDILTMITSMLSATNAAGQPERRNMHYVIDSNVLWRTSPLDYFFRGAHAPGANDDSIGLEHNRVTGMLDVQPVDTAQTVMSIVRIARERNWPINPTTIWTHSEVDLLENNPAYDRETGVLRGTLRKSDYPQDYLLDVLIPLAQQLDASLGPR